MQHHIPEKRLRSEVDKALTAPFKLKRFIVLSTSKTSTELQIAISQINAAHMEIGQFIVEFNGWDEIGLTLRHADDIKAYEERRKRAEPWIFS